MFKTCKFDSRSWIYSLFYSQIIKSFFFDSRSWIYSLFYSQIIKSCFFDSQSWIYSLFYSQIIKTCFFMFLTIFLLKSWYAVMNLLIILLTNHKNMFFQLFNNIFVKIMIRGHEFTHYFTPKPWKHVFWFVFPYLLVIRPLKH